MGGAPGSDEGRRRAADPRGGVDAARARGPAAEDLTSDPVLARCRRVQGSGGERPSIGGLELIARIGKGGMGVVYYALNSRVGAELAVKVLPQTFDDDHAAMVERLVREARLAANLRSDHLVRVFDVDRDEATGHHFLVMEYVRGRSAGAWRREIRDAGGRGAPEAAALDVVIAATTGLATAHEAGVVHRDVKPDNILIPDDAWGRPLFAQAKLADLGLARPETGEHTLTRSAVPLGTPGYMPPEQVQDAKRAKKPADVFSMGATLYALLAGKAPFSGVTPMAAILQTVQKAHAPIRTVRPDVSRATADLLDRCLAKNPDKRYPDAAALLAALERCRAALRVEPAEPAVVETHVAPGPRPVAPTRSAWGWSDVRWFTPLAVPFALFLVLQSPMKASPVAVAAVGVAAVVGVAIHFRLTSADAQSTGEAPRGLQLARVLAVGLAIGLTVLLVVTGLEPRPPRRGDDPTFVPPPALCSLVIAGGDPGRELVGVVLRRIEAGRRFAAVAGTDRLSVNAEGRCVVADLPAGVYELSIPSDGVHSELIQTVTLTSGDDARNKVAWPRTRGFVAVRSDPNTAWVRMDGVEIGKTPTRVPLAEGAHTFEVSAPGHRTRVVRTEVKFGESPDAAPVSISLEALPARLVLDRLSPGVSAYLDDDKTPAAPGSDITAGKHTVRMVREGYTAPDRTDERDVAAGAEWVVEDPKWTRAVKPHRLDLGGLPADAVVQIDGATWDPKRTLGESVDQAVLHRPGYQPYGLKLMFRDDGVCRVADLLPSSTVWPEITLRLISFPTDTHVYLKSELGLYRDVVSARAIQVPGGEYQLEIFVKSSRDQHAWTRPINARHGETIDVLWVAAAAAPPQAQPSAAGNPLRRVLEDVEEWRNTDYETRKAAAMWVLKIVNEGERPRRSVQFQYLGEVISPDLPVPGFTGHYAVFETEPLYGSYVKARFVLVPGYPARSGRAAIRPFLIEQTEAYG